MSGSPASPRRLVRRVLPMAVAATALGTIVAAPNRRRLPRCGCTASSKPSSSST